MAIPKGSSHASLDASDDDELNLVALVQTLQNQQSKKHHKKMQMVTKRVEALCSSYTGAVDTEIARHEALVTAKHKEKDQATREILEQIDQAREALDELLQQGKVSISILAKMLDKESKKSDAVNDTEMGLLQEYHEEESKVVSEMLDELWQDGGVNPQAK